MKRLAVILAGGKSERMGGRDKAEMRLGDTRLIDHVAARLAPQTDEIVISGRSDYGLDVPAIHDDPDAPGGPSAGLRAAARWIAANRPAWSGFFTAPVDGPSIPSDLIEKLEASGRSALAADEEGLHPTYAYWVLRDLNDAFAALAGRSSISLRAVAEACNAGVVSWPGRENFRNINTPEDLRAWSRGIV